MGKVASNEKIKLTADYSNRVAAGAAIFAWVFPF